jgi:hypothetical protein
LNAPYRSAVAVSSAANAGAAIHNLAMANEEIRWPYSAYAPLPAWDVVDRAIYDLIENQDLEEQIGHNHIVGFIVKSLSDAEQLRVNGPIDDRPK